MKPIFPLILAALMTTNSPAATLPPPPDVAQKPHEVKAPFGATRNDEYYWLRDDTRKDKAMLAYLGAENAYADAYMAPLKPLQDELYEEIVGRIKQDDSSVPYRERGYWYYTRFETGHDYPIHARRKGTMEARRGNPARRERDGRRQGLSSSVGDWVVSQDNTHAGLGRRRHRPPPVHDPLQEPRHRRELSRT